MELINKINSLNNEVKKLNNERNIALGKKETLTQQLNQGIADYNAKFQTNISADTVEAELTKVTTEVQAKATKLEEAITQIKSGNYTEANSTLDIKSVVPVEETTQAPVEPTTVHSVPEVPVVPEAPVQQSVPVAPVAPVMPTAPSEPERPAPAERPAPDAASFLDMLNLAPGAAPAQPSTPTATVGGGMSFAAKVEAVAEPSAPVAPVAPSAPAEPKVGLPPTNFTTFMGV